jgi:hypothetical protein
MHRHQLTRALAILILAHSGVAGAQSSALTGAWERVSLRDSTGTMRQPPAPAAFTIYSSDGYFSQTAIPTGRPTIDKPLTEMTKEELVARFERASAGRGSYTISGNRLTRKSLSNINPALEGGELVQLFRIVGDTLILSSPNPASKGEARFVRVR